MSTLERLRKLFVNRFDFNIEELRPTSPLENLGLDSLDKIEFLFIIENEFKIKIAGAKFKATTIQDMVDAINRLVKEQTPDSLNSR